MAEPELSDKPTNQPISGYFIDGNQKNQSYKQTSLNILAIILEQLQPVRLTPELPVRRPRGAQVTLLKWPKVMSFGAFQEIGGAVVTVGRADPWRIGSGLALLPSGIC